MTPADGGRPQEAARLIYIRRRSRVGSCSVNLAAPGPLGSSVSTRPPAHAGSLLPFDRASLSLACRHGQQEGGDPNRAASIGRLVYGYALRTLLACCLPFCPTVISNVTAWPSSRVLKPSTWISLKWTNTIVATLLRDEAVAFVGIEPLDSAF